jgi:hypothetical protein
LGKQFKILRTKLKILEFHQNKFKNPQILKQYPTHYFPACETSKMTRRKLKIPKFQNTKIENFQNSHEERHIPGLLVKRPPNDKKKIEDPQTLKNKKFPKFTK